MEVADTIPKVFAQKYHTHGDNKIAVVQKDFGIWKPYTWKDQYDIVKYFAVGLISQGLEPGGRVAIVGDSDRHWYWARWAIMAAGGVVVGMYADSIPSELKYLAEHSESSFCIADDQEQVDKMLEIREELPQLSKIIYWDPKGLSHYNDPMLIGFYQVVEEGKKCEQEHPGAFEEMVDRVKPDDIALLIYTSGTSGVPKGAIITHKSMLTGVLGRVGEEVKARGMFIHPRQLQEVMSRFDQISRFQVVVSLHDHADVKTINIELKDDTIDNKQLSGSLMKDFQNLCRVRPDKVEILARGTIPEGSKSILDQRVWK